MLRVAYQGAPGAYSEEAIAVFWGESAERVPSRWFDDAVAALAAGRVDAAVVPVENSRTGIIGESVAALLTLDHLQVLGETDISVRHQLLAVPGASLETVRQVESHPAALAQCHDWLARHRHLSIVVVDDTAGSARDIALSRDPTRGAIASAAAGIRYGLSVLARDLQDDPYNRTRFWAVCPRDVAVPGLDVGAGVRNMNRVTVESAVERLRHEVDAARDSGAQRVPEPGTRWRTEGVTQ